MMIRNILFALVIAVACNAASTAQVYFTKNGRIAFFSKTVLENIDADNNQVISIIDLGTGTVQFSLLNNAFHFPKAKMEEDFNEDYMESGQFPRSTFKGAIANIKQVNFKDGIFPVMVTGELMIHGIKRNISIPGNLIIKNGQISATANFKIFLKDYNIKVPSVVSNKISESIDVTVNCIYQKK